MPDKGEKQSPFFSSGGAVASAAAAASGILGNVFDVSDVCECFRMLLSVFVLFLLVLGASGPHDLASSPTCPL